MERHIVAFTAFNASKGDEDQRPGIAILPYQPWPPGLGRFDSLEVVNDVRQMVQYIFRRGVEQGKQEVQDELLRALGLSRKS